MKLRKAAALVLVTVMAATVFAGCGKGNTGEGETKGADREKALDLRTLTQDEIEEGAKKEGRVSSVGMPDEWAHWDLSWASILEKYGLEHDDVDLSSGEEIATFVAEKDDPTKDVGMWATRLPPRQWTKDVFSPIRFPAGILFPTGQRIRTATGL